MLKKRLGINAIERDWYWEVNGSFIGNITGFFKIPSTLIIPESVEKIDGSAFNVCENSTITLKKPMSEFKEIGFYAFHGCRDVKEEIRS